MKTLNITLFTFAIAILGLFACDNTAETTETTETVVEETVEANEYTYDATNSTFEWLGEKFGGEHFGTIDLQSGKVSVENAVWTAAEFNIDMTSIVVTDIPAEEEDNAYLAGHLKDADFFAVDSFPTASFVMTAANGNEITGDLTIKGQALPNTFTVSQNEEGAYTGTMIIDRTQYGIIYSSQSFFDDLGDRFIYDEFMIDFVLATK